MKDKKELNGNQLNEVNGGVKAAESAFDDSDSSPAFIIGEIVECTKVDSKVKIIEVSSKREKQGWIWKNYQFKYKVQEIKEGSKPFYCWEYQIRKEGTDLPEIAA